MDTPNPSEGKKIKIEIAPDTIVKKRGFVPGTFTLAILFFFFTFCDFNCGGHKIASMTGVEFVVGTKLKSNKMFDNQSSSGNDDRQVHPNIWAIIALGSAVIGLGAYLVKFKKEEAVGIAAGALGVASLIVLQVDLKSSIDKEVRGMIEISFKFGYWAALLSLALAATLCFLRLRMKRRKTPEVVVTVPQEEGI